MEYARFVRLRGASWDGFESGLRRLEPGGRRASHGDVEALAFQYRQLLHDHAVAAARFPGTGAARRLRHLAFLGTRSLYVDTPSGGGIRRFLARTFPLAFRAHAPYFALVTSLFAVALALGFTLALVEPGLGVVFLGPAAIEGLREGRLWTDALVTTVPPAVSSSGIATNNMSVALTGWAGGAAAGVGAFYVVVLNGFLLGAVVGTTVHYALADRLLAFISAHGPLEITLILVTAAAGLGLGHALVAADDRPRGVAMGEASRRALAVLIGCLPWFAALAAVEAVVSPSPFLSPALKLAVGLALLGAFLAVAWNPLLRE